MTFEWGSLYCMDTQNNQSFCLFPPLFSRFLSFSTSPWPWWFRWWQHSLLGWFVMQQILQDMNTEISPNRTKSAWRTSSTSIRDSAASIARLVSRTYSSRSSCTRNQTYEPCFLFFLNTKLCLLIWKELNTSSRQHLEWHFVWTKVKSQSHNLHCIPNEFCKHSLRGLERMHDDQEQKGNGFI